MAYNIKTIMIITLFKEGNIFGKYASLTYGPQLTNVEMLVKMNRQSIIYNINVYRIRSS